MSFQKEKMTPRMKPSRMPSLSGNGSVDEERNRKWTPCVMTQEEPVPSG